MCFPVKFFLGVFFCYVIINVVLAVVLYCIYLIQQPWMKPDLGDVGVTEVGNNAYIFVSAFALMSIVVAVVNLLMLIGLTMYARVITTVEMSDEERPLLQKA
jgi:membrane-anchored protein YejM (alkaline phosphatase superfamily)